MTATVTDLFCGAGGSSLGAAASGMRLVMAANHWATAIEVHQAHFPEAGHDCADISQVDPRRYPRTDVLLASPECTNHSQARGISRRRQDPTLWDAPDPAAERSRATMWDVVRFAEQMRYSAVVVENVVEATRWVLWPAWLQAMLALGYRHRVLSHNSMHHGVPQSRDRIYVVFWRSGLAPDLELELSARCVRCGQARTVRQAWKNGRTVGRYRQQWHWACATCGTACDPGARPAADIIDWALPAPRIGDRPRPLAAATRARVLAGLRRYGWAPTATGAGNAHEHAPGNPTWTVNASDDRPALVVPLRRNGRAQPVDGALPTITAGGTHHALVLSDTHQYRRQPAGAPPTAVTTGNRHALIVRDNTARGDRGQVATRACGPAETVAMAGHRSLLVPYNGTGKARPAGDPLGTQPTRDRWALVDPEAVVDECGFRMLEPHEVAAAMALPDGYLPGWLTKRDRVRLAGNAVTPPVMAWLCGRVLHALGEAGR